MQMVLSSDDPSVSTLYIGNRMKIYCYDGQHLRLVINEPVEAWTIRNQMLYYTAMFTDISRPAGFSVLRRSIGSSAASAVTVGSVKGSRPLDVKLVGPDKTGWYKVLAYQVTYNLLLQLRSNC